MIDCLGGGISSCFLLHIIASLLELLRFLVAFFDLLVVLEVSEEFAPRDKLFVVYRVLLLR